MDVDVKAVSVAIEADSVERIVFWYPRYCCSKLSALSSSSFIPHLEGESIC